ncbi:MAG: substrate-binding periplasmic protein [Bacillota bacterium]
MMKKSSVSLAVILLLVMSVLAACGGAKQSGSAGGGDGSLDRVKKAGVLKVAIDASYPPMEFVDKDGKTYIGFDVDYATELAKKLGVKAQFENVAWDGILTGLKAGKYDVIMSSMNITEERLKEVNFVEYAQMAQNFVSRKGFDVKTEKDLAGKIVAVQAETTSHMWADEQKAKGIAIKEINSFPGATDAFLALKNERADVVVIDEPVARYYAKLDGHKVTGQAMGAEPVGIAIRKEDVDLMKALEQAVKDTKADGTFKKLSEKWFGSELGK